MPSEFPNASLIRRGAAMLYDAMLIIAMMIIASIPLAAIDASGNDSSFISDQSLRFLYQVYLFYLIFAFYYVFWRIKGQTLGMQVWKIRTIAEDGDIMSPVQCIVRFAVATPGTLLLFAGFLWAIFDKEGLTLHDRISRSRVVYVGDKPYKSEKRSLTAD